MNCRATNSAGVIRQTILGILIAASAVLHAQNATTEVESFNRFGSSFGNNGAPGSGPGGGPPPGSGTESEPEPPPETIEAKFTIDAHGKQVKYDCAVCHWLEVYVDDRKLEFEEAATLKKGETYEITVKDNPQTSGSPPDGATPPEDDTQLYTVWPIPADNQTITPIASETAGSPPLAFLVEKDEVLQYLIDNTEGLLAQYKEWPASPADEPMRKKAHILPVEIIPDDGMVGVVGDMVPSNKGELGEKHFVTPQKTPQIDEDYVTFKVIGISPEAFERLLDWGPGGEEVAGEPLKRKVKRDIAAKTTITVMLKNSSQEVERLNTWVVWAAANLVQVPTPVFYTTSNVSLVDGTTADRANFVAGSMLEDSLVFEFTIYPVGLCNLADDIPDLRGAPSSTAPGGNSPLKPAIPLASGAEQKWDDSRAIQISITNPNIPRAKYPATSALVDNPTILAGQPENGIVLAFPTDDVVGNDDAEFGTSSGGNPYEVNDSAPIRLRHGIGVMRSDDRPMSSISSYLSENEVYEELNEFREFLRLNIGNKWYRVSPYKHWEFRLRTKKENSIMINQGAASGSTL